MLTWMRYLYIVDINNLCILFGNTFSHSVELFTLPGGTALLGSSLRRAGAQWPPSTYPSVHRCLPLPGAPGSPGQPRRMDSLSEPSRHTSFTSAEKRGVGVRALVAGPTTGRPNQECLPQGDLVPRLRHVSLVSDERSAWQWASCLWRSLVGGEAVPGRALALDSTLPVPSPHLHAGWLWASHSSPLSSGNPNGGRNKAVGRIRSDNADF